MIKKQEIYARSKNEVLTGNKQFRKDINALRKMLNEYYKLDVFVHDEIADELSHDISIQFDVMIPKYEVSFTVLCSILRASKYLVTQLTVNYPIKGKSWNRHPKPCSYLVDRQHYARHIINKTMKVKDIVKLTGFTKATINKWARDYKKFGNKMTNQAIAFRREL